MIPQIGRRWTSIAKFATGWNAGFVPIGGPVSIGGSPSAASAPFLYSSSGAATWSGVVKSSDALPIRGAI
ncbi:MAG TPA: hypothetical protein VG454_02545 [Gemmatimonadales bacterium]|nr:hypothetical protein [Gemmatimonadales bacterium]